MDKHLAILSKIHFETKFVKIDAEKSPFLTERLKIFMLPTLALIKKEKTVDYVVGFDDLGGSDDFKTARERTNPPLSPAAVGKAPPCWEVDRPALPRAVCVRFQALLASLPPPPSLC